MQGRSGSGAGVGLLERNTVEARSKPLAGPGQDVNRHLKSRHGVRLRSRAWVAVVDEELMSLESTLRGWCLSVLMFARILQLRWQRL